MSRTEAQNKATYKYAKSHLKRVPLDLQLSDYEELKRAADASGMSVNGFIKQAIKSAISSGAVPWGDSARAGSAGVSPEITDK